MKYSHWELLLEIYKCQKENKYSRMSSVQVNKNLMKTCYKNEWVKKLDDGTLIVTKKGEEAAKEIAPLYERDREQIGQTF